jgi:signal transduction histidine kinase
MSLGMSSVPGRWQVPPIDRDERWVGGVAAALAAELGVEPLAVRAGFVLLAAAGGWGLVLYAVAWIALMVLNPSSRLAPYAPQPKGASVFRRYLGLGLVVLGLVLLLQASGVGFVDDLAFSVGFVCVGMLIAWSRQREEGGTATAARAVIGLVVAGAGLAMLVTGSLSFFESLQLLVVAVAIVGGATLILAPSLIRVGHAFDTERQERVRADERARMAAHLHDSVLQTLTLIQRNAADPQRTAQIARQQERELRQWLYGKEASSPGAVRLDRALQDMANRVEELHGIQVEVVTVGDTSDLDPAAIEGVVSAAQEAATNAAKHAGVARVDVFAERRNDPDGEVIEVFVRDAGRGFDPDAVEDDRQGIRASIMERMARHGGSATIHSEPGHGTEVELIQPLAQPVGGTP